MALGFFLMPGWFYIQHKINPKNLVSTSQIAVFVIQQDTSWLQYLPGSTPILAFQNKLHFWKTKNSPKQVEAFPSDGQGLRFFRQEFLE